MNTQSLPTHLLKLLLLVGLIATGLSGRVSALVLDEENRKQVILESGATVILIGEATSSPTTRSRRYYYLPFNLRLSSRPDGTPEFLFLKFTTEARGGASGGLMHFLMEWGATPAQEAEIKSKLSSEERGAELVGPVPMTAAGDAGSFKIVSATLEDRTLSPTAPILSGQAPLVPGGKVATAARLTAAGAQLLAASLEGSRSISDVSIALNFNYATLAPAVHGTISIDWSKLETEKESIRAEYRRRRSGTSSSSSCFMFFCASSERAEYTYSRDELREQYKFLQEKQIVKVQFDELATLPEEKVGKVREAFFQFFLNMMAQPADQQNPPPPPPGEDDKRKNLDIEKSNGYRYNYSAIRRNITRKTQRMELNYRLTFLNPFSIVGNLASWYNGVRDNPKCVASVNLNDPFFQHRDIHFILDGDVKDMFEEAINYVTINVRKRRTEGRAFEDRLTIDSKYIKEKGIDGLLTYARGEDRNPDNYEYQTQWSLRGGRIYPADPPWKSGNWEGQTLALPVVPRTIQLEGDIDGMKSSDITRITAQIHYRKFGEEVEENISISPAENKPIVDKRIFIDRNARGFAYRLILYHKTEGRLALPWAPQSDNYIYAGIPADMLGTPSLKDAAKEAARTVATGASEKVLERFSELVGERP